MKNKLLVSLFVCAFAVGLSSCKKEVKVPLEVNVDDMTALLGSGEIDVDMVLAYTPVFVEDWDAQVDEAKENKDPSAKKTFAEDTKKSKDVLHALNKVAAQLDGDEAMELNRYIKKLERIIGRAESYLNEGGGQSAPAASHSSRSVGPSFYAEMSLEAQNRYFDHSDVSGLNRDELALLRNSIYARHNRIFVKQKFSSYFSQYDWYSPLYTDDDIQLNRYEQANVSFIKRYE